MKGFAAKKIMMAAPSRSVLEQENIKLKNEIEDLRAEQARLRLGGADVLLGHLGFRFELPPFCTGPLHAGSEVQAVVWERSETLVAGAYPITRAWCANCNPFFAGGRRS